MSDDEILSGLMRRILQSGATVTWYSDRGPTVRLDNGPYAIGPEEIEAMRRAVEDSLSIAESTGHVV